MGAETGCPKAMHNFSVYLDKRVGGAAPECLAAAGWCRRAADSGLAVAACNLSNMYSSGRGRAWQMIPATFYTLVSWIE
jgi:TPR repeat protein